MLTLAPRAAFGEEREKGGSHPGTRLWEDGHRILDLEEAVQCCGNFKYNLSPHSPECHSGHHTLWLCGLRRCFNLFLSVPTCTVGLVTREMEFL